MPDGSPIDQWWKSHRPPRAASASTRVCAADRYGLAYCRTKRNAGVSTNRAQVTCGDCLAAIAADESTEPDWYDTHCPTCDAPEPTHTPTCAVVHRSSEREPGDG